MAKHQIKDINDSSLRESYKVLSIGLTFFIGEEVRTVRHGSTSDLTELVEGEVFSSSGDLLMKGGSCRWWVLGGWVYQNKIVCLCGTGRKRKKKEGGRGTEIKREIKTVIDR